MNAQPKINAGKTISRLVTGYRGPMISIAIFSLVSNLLLLTGPLFMLQIYDRVLTSGSVPTLVALSILAATLYALYGFFEFIRSRIMVRVGRLIDETLRERMFDIVSYHALHNGEATGSRPLNDLMTVRQFLSGPGPLVFFDIPWTPVFLAVIFLLHPVLGIAAVIAVIVMAILAAINNKVVAADAAAGQAAAFKARKLHEQARENAGVASVLGMLGPLRARWLKVESKELHSLTRASDRGGAVTSATRSARFMFQSGILGLGAYLAIQQQISPGTMIAASIIMGRALAPVDQAVAHWQAFLRFTRSWKFLNNVLQVTPEKPKAMELPVPAGHLSVDKLSAYAPGVAAPIVKGISFELKPGTGLGIIGPTGAGKTTLALALIGLWPNLTGNVRLDGAEFAQWDAGQLGRYIGYLPQEVELFDGTIGENISRFDPGAEPAAIVEAARQAAIHQLVLQFADGYDTPLGEGGVKLSTGQRQRIGLARALYGDPNYVVLDEPNANLDAEGEAALIQAIAGVRRRGGTVIVVAHRPSAIATLNQLMVLKDGAMLAWGPKEEVLAKFMAKPMNPQQRPAGITAAAGTAPVKGSAS